MDWLLGVVALVVVVAGPAGTGLEPRDDVGPAEEITIAELVRAEPADPDLARDSAVSNAEQLAQSFAIGDKIGVIWLMTMVSGSSGDVQQARAPTAGAISAPRSAMPVAQMLDAGGPLGRRQD